MYTSDKEAIILEHIYFNDSFKQRELADKAGISLGMTNAILKRLIEKGWLMTKRLNSRNISYVVSPAGMEEIFKRGYRYFKRTIDDVHLYKDGIEQVISMAVGAGYKTITLVGDSDLDFIVEYICGKYDIEFKKSKKVIKNNENVFILYSEQYEINDKIANTNWLRTIIMRQK
jgi:predicted transcriptional regulator